MHFRPCSNISPPFAVSTLRVTFRSFSGGKPWLSIHVDAVESLDPAHLPDLTVPASALAVGPRADEFSAVKAGSLIKRAVPVYPVTAKAQHVECVVMVSALIATDGHVEKVHVLAGPPLLHQPAMDAVRKWVY
jgi:outer membrane biosynthesis protein TonB